MTLKNKGNPVLKNNPYPLSGTVGASVPSRRSGTISFSGSIDQQYGHGSSSQPSLPTSSYDNHVPGNSDKSTAPTLSTNGDTALSEAAYSKAGTMATGGGGVGGGEGSTFSSPAPSVRSLTTTLTTVQSAAPSTQIYGAPNSYAQNSAGLPHVNSTQSNTSQPIQFSHQFPSSAASAVPPHVFANGQPSTYSTATANGLLTDNASILTLASSSKRRRRNSLDTNASVRALAPSSIFGGSRESLPLSVLSANVVETPIAPAVNASGVHSRPSIGGLASAERASVYSSSGIAALVSGGERNSFIASKHGDTGSIRSGVHSMHTRNDSAAGSVTGGTGGSALASPVVGPPSATTGRISRRSSGWGELTGDGDDEDAEREACPKQDDERDETARTDQTTEEPDQCRVVPDGQGQGVQT
jgi:hypothetical protein